MESVGVGKEKAKRGRPLGSGSKLTQAAIEIICSRVRLGMSFKSAAIQAGVKESTFHKWHEKAKASQGGIYAYFLQQLQAAVEDAKAWHLENIRVCAQGEEYEETRTKYDAKGNVIEKEIMKKRVKRDPSCSKWILAKRHPDEFGDKLEVTGEGMVTKVLIVPASDEEEKEIAAMNASIMPAPEDN